MITFFFFTRTRIQHAIRVCDDDQHRKDFNKSILYQKAYLGSGI